MNDKKSYSIMNRRLRDRDTELLDLINKESRRQQESIELIASENYTSLSVMECLGSCLTNKYSEGYPGRRYYGGNEIIDKIENLAIERSLDAFSLNKEEWGANVQCYSGSVANMAAYLGVIKPNDRIMGLDLPSGGHLTHGFESKNGKKISHSSLLFTSMPYRVKQDGYIDYDELETLAMAFKPKLIICGASAYPRDYDYERFRSIADKSGSLLLSDMSHFNGFVATKLHNNPFDYCDIVTTTTHKTLRGPRAAVIFYKNKFANKINQSVFPGLQGGPHNHQIAAIATQMKEVATPAFAQYMNTVRENARFFARELQNLGFQIQTNGTDNHLLLVNLKNKNVTGNDMEVFCENINISLNKNCVPEDTSPLKPSGIRIGTSAITTRNIKKEDITELANILNEITSIINRERLEQQNKKIRDIIENNKEDVDRLKLRIINITATLDYYESNVGMIQEERKMNDV